MVSGKKKSGMLGISGLKTTWCKAVNNNSCLNNPKNPFHPFRPFA
jgi:hypothetical protein